MRMFQFVSGHSSEKSIAHYSSRPTVSQLKGISDAISNWSENHQPQRTQISASLTLLSLIFKLESNGLQIDHNRKFSERFFQLLQYSRQRPSFSVHRVTLMTKTDFAFPAFSLRFVDFVAQFCFHCKFSFHEKRRSSQVWQWRDFPGPITILCYA